MNAEEIKQLIENRRSHFVKEFNGNVAPIELIDQLIQNAHWAPNHKLTLPWRFIVIGQSKLPELVSSTKAAMMATNPDLPTEKLAKIEKVGQAVSHAVAIVLKPSNLVPLWEEYAAIGAAVQNMYLTLDSWDDFGGYWTTGMASNSDLVRQFLELTPEEQHLGYFLIGGLNTKRKQAHRPAPQIDYRL